MADTKISALGQLTPGSALASGDLAVVVDISDTSMAASGTDKRITAADLAVGLAPLGASQNATVRMQKRLMWR